MIKAYTPEVEAETKVSRHSLEILRDALADVVNSPNGTGTKAKLEGITVCGKTGTAQVLKMAQGERTKTESMAERNRDHGWFVAFAPKDHPKIAIACVVEHGGHGGSSAAPVVHDVLAAFFGINPNPPDKEKPEVASKSKRKQEEEMDEGVPDEDDN